MYAIVAHMVGGSFTGPELIPSPKRLFGALVSSAYRRGKNLDILRELEESTLMSLSASTLRDPKILTGYVANNLAEAVGKSMSAVEWEKKYVSRTGKQLIYRSLPTTATFGYLIEGGPDRESLQDICDGVSYLGRGGDMAYLTVEDHLPEGLRFLPGDRLQGSVALQMWTPGLLSHYGRLHTSRQHNTAAVDMWNTVSHWNLAETSDAHWNLYPTVRPEDPMRISRLLRESRSTVPGLHSLPALDNRGKVRGVMTPYCPEDFRVDRNEETTLLDLYGDPTLKCQKIDNWIQESGQWVSATPVSGHPDPTVMQWMVEREGFEVLEMSRQPFDYGQAPDVRYRDGNALWWMRIRGESGGQPVQLGDDVEFGAGMFRPEGK